MSTIQLMLEWSGELWTTWLHLNSVKEINWKKESCCPGSEQVYSTLLCFPESIVGTFPYSKSTKLTSILYMWRKKKILTSTLGALSQSLLNSQSSQ